MSLDPAIASRLAASDARLVITGTGGWLGMATLDLLHTALGRDFRDRVHCFGSAERPLVLRDGTTVIQKPLAAIGNLPPAQTLVLHTAFLTKDRAESMSEDEYRAANRAISQLVLSALDPIGATGLFLASSGATGRAGDTDANPAMRLYGQLKVEDEERFANWADACGKRAVIARIFNISGPYINKHSAYALASFILDALAGQKVRVAASRPVIRSYVAIRELMSLIFALLLEEDRGVATLDSGGEAMELGDAARIVADALHAPGAERAPVRDQAADRYVGDGEHYAALLRRAGIAPVPFADQVRETAGWLTQSAGRTCNAAIGASAT